MIMSVYQRTDVDDERAGKDTGVERSDHRRGDRGGVKGGVIMDRRGGGERSGVALKNRTTRRLL